MNSKTVVLSARMKALTDLVSKGMVVCDIGCDHGFVSIYLVQAGIAPKVFAMDVNKGPLLRAGEHIAEYGLTDKIETRLSDGLQKLAPGEAHAMICAGMGGKLMMKILEEGEAQVACMEELILQPQSELAWFRENLREKGYTIVDEDMIFEDGKFYPMMKVVPKKLEGTEESDSAELNNRDIYDSFGKHLLCKKHPVLKDFLEFSERNLSEILTNLEKQPSERTSQRQEELKQQLGMIHKAKAYME